MFINKSSAVLKVFHLVAVCIVLNCNASCGFMTARGSSRWTNALRSRSYHRYYTRSLNMVLLPLGCPYAQPCDEPNMVPDYKPVEGYLGTCAPGSTPENAPLYELDMTVQIPAPHFQVVPFHNVWQTGHPMALDMVDFIEEEGLWMDEQEEQEEAIKRAANKSIMVSVVEDFVDDTLDEADDFLDDDMLEDALGISSR